MDSIHLGETLGNSTQHYEQNVNFSSKSSELLNEFKGKTQKITDLMKGKCFSIMDLRNKIIQGHNNATTSITAQVPVVNNWTKVEVQVNMYTPGPILMVRSQGILA